MTMRGPDPTDRTGVGRGQAFSLEAIVAAVVLLGGIVFALQVSGVTALTDTTSSGDVLQQQERLATSLVDVAVTNESLGPTLRYWNESNRSFHGLEDVEADFYTEPPTRTTFGRLLNRTAENWRLTYNVDLYAVDGNRSVRHRPLVRNGVPSDDAVSAARTVTLYDDDRILDETGTPTDRTLENATFYLPDRYPDGPVYAVVRVEVTVWPL